MGGVGWVVWVIELVVGEVERVSGRWLCGVYRVRKVE